MDDPVHRHQRRIRTAQPLDPTRLNELALTYVARFATSGAKLERYLARKLRERGWDGDGEPDIAGVVRRLCDLGYVDDAAYASIKTGSLLRRGYGQRRVNEALSQAGISEAIRQDARVRPADGRRAALALARKRRFGPFGPALPDRAQREKQLAAMLRAGHPLDSAREMVDAPSVEAAETWAAEAEDDES